MKLFLLSFCFLTSSLFGEIVWETEYQKALERSRSESKPLLLFFTGSDWSGWGMKLKKEILDSAEFQSAVSEKIVCLEVDFPQQQSLPEQTARQNEELKQRFEISELPRVVLLDPKYERLLARMAFLPGGGKCFAEALFRIIDQDRQLTESMASIQSGTSRAPSELQVLYKWARDLQRETEAMAILESGISSDAPDFFLLEKYRILVEERHMAKSSEALALRNRLVDADPENRKGMQFSLALIDFQALSQQAVDPKEAILPLEQYISSFGLQDQENVWRVEMMVAQFYLNYDDNQTALKHAETAFLTAPDEKKADIQRSIDYIRKQLL